MLELYRQWLAALRGGGYDQGKSSLRNVKNEFCCLGVYCDLKDSTAWSYREPYYEFLVECGFASMFLPREYQLEIGLTSEELCVLMEMNDGGKTFAEIADYIEQVIMPTKSL